MIATNRAVRQARNQIFASDHSIVTPFFNRVASKDELKSLFEDREALEGTAVIISSPFGTGKTFFIDFMGPQFGIVHKERALRAPGIGAAELRRASGDVLFLDEADTKTTWSMLDEGLAHIGEELAKSGRTALLLGDFALRNTTLLDRLPKVTRLTTFEPLDPEFLRGVIAQRLREYIGEGTKAVDDIVDDELYDVLVPESMARVNSLRTVLAFLQQVAGDLPHDSQPCRITVDMARENAVEQLNKLLNGLGDASELQERFLEVLLDYMRDTYSDGGGLADGLDAATMMALGESAGCRSWAELNEEIIDPFGRNDLLLSRGTPEVADGMFVRYVEPFFPSLQLVLIN